MQCVPQATTRMDVAAVVQNSTCAGKQQGSWLLRRGWLSGAKNQQIPEKVGLCMASGR